MQAQRNRERSTQRSVGRGVRSNVNVVRANANLKEINMRVRFGKASNLLVWGPWLALGLLCAAGVATLLRWIPTPTGLGDRPAVRTQRAPPPQSTGPAISAAHAIEIGPAGMLCSPCRVTRQGGPIDGSARGKPDSADAWFGHGRAVNAEAVTSGKAGLAALIAWHVCVRTERGCE